MEQTKQSTNPINKMAKQKIEELLESVVDAQIAEHTPKPAPEMEGRGKVRVLMPLSDRLIRFYVLRQMAVARQKKKALGHIHAIFRAVFPKFKPLIDTLTQESLPEGVTLDSLVGMVEGMGEQISEAISGIGVEPTEEDKLDGAVQKAFTNELTATLMAHLASNANHDGPPVEKLRDLEYDIYVHDGQWVVAAERCVCLSCRLQSMLSSVTEKASPDELSQEMLDQLEEKYPGSARVLTVEDLDLSDILDGTRDDVRANLASALDDGTIVLDLGHGKTPRFAMVAPRVGHIAIELPDPEMLAELFGEGFGMPDQTESTKGGAPKRRTGGLAGWFGRVSGSH